MAQQLGPKELQVKALREARAARVQSRSEWLGKMAAKPSRLQSLRDGVDQKGRGRPKREGDPPWKQAGVSRRTWYRRQQGGQ
jgi:hypothetical protein